MASLLVAASFLTYNKIKDKRAAKKEAKRKGYESRYHALEREHSQALQDQQEKHVQAQPTGPSQSTDRHVPAATAETEIPASQRQDASSALPARRRSSESDRASTRSRDGPSSWVDEVLREREKRGDVAQTGR
jgi:hypothetical protein